VLDKHLALRDRTKRFALLIIKLCQSLPKMDAARTIGRQLLRSATAVAANYRAVGRSRSRAEFVAKMGVVVEETDESVFWLELLEESGLVSVSRVGDLTVEANEVVAIFVASQRTARETGTTRCILGSPDRRTARLPGSCSPDRPIFRSPDR
jgi:four helix bundle protein